MATLPQSNYLSLEEFDRLYGDSKPYREYWFGTAIAKPTPTTLHALLQMVLALLLDEAGFVSLPELRLKLSKEAHPIPDVVATSGPMPGDYPTEPFDIAIEILSPSDSAQHLLRKCRLYASWGIPSIFVFDPEDRTAYTWSHERAALEPISAMDFPGKPSLPLDRVWDELDLRRRRLERS